MKHRISVAMATYNGEAYIKEQLVSILEQTRPVDEIIIYDDCSEDATCTMIETLRNTNGFIQLFSQEKRVGYVKNFASALKATTGDIIFLSDQDDIWEKNKIARMVSVFESDDEATCVASGFTLIDAGSNTIEREDKGNNHGLSWNIYEPNKVYTIDCHELMYHNIAMGCTFALRASLKEEYLQKSSMLSAHDWELFFLAALKQGAKFYNRAFIRYRIHDNNTTGNDKIRKKTHIYEATRKKNAQTLLTWTQALEAYWKDMDTIQKETLQSLRDFHKKRVALVCDGHMQSWFSLLRNYGVYKKITSKKGMIVDFLYAIHK